MDDHENGMRFEPFNGARFQIKTPIDGTEPEVMIDAINGVCQACPALAECNPHTFPYTTSTFSHEIIVVGLDVTAEFCLLFNGVVNYPLSQES